jgi:phospholipid/cholesterol/gamma-HCH transport system substrate-binding protein
VNDYEAMQRRRSFIVGVFVIIAAIAFFSLIYKFGDLPGIVSEIKSFEVNIQFPSAPGVQKDTPVRFCGYQVGRVSKVLEPDVRKDLNTQEYLFQVLVVASIDNQYYNKIPNIVEAKLMSRGFGSSYIELRVPRQEFAEGKFLTQGSLLQGSTGVSSEFFPEETQRKFDELIKGISKLVDNTNEVIGSAENKANIKDAISNIAEASKQAVDMMKQIQDAAAAAKTTIENTDVRIESLTKSLITTSDKLSEVMKHLDGIVEKINRGESTMGKLINDGRLYEQLLEDSRQLDLVLKDIKAFVEQSKEKGLPIKIK